MFKNDSSLPFWTLYLSMLMTHCFIYVLSSVLYYEICIVDMVMDVPCITVTDVNVPSGLHLILADLTH